MKSSLGRSYPALHKPHRGAQTKPGAQALGQRAATIQALKGRSSRRGSILVVAMILLFAIAAVALVLGQSMRVEMIAAGNAARAREAAVIQRGAEQYVLALLAQSTDPVEELEDRHFEAVQLGEGYFWILRPDWGDPVLPPFGLVDETSKLNLNHAIYESFAAMPGLTEELAASIIDWVDEDDEPTQGNGAESQTYLSRTPGHEAKNAAFETIEELRLVEGFTEELLWGDSSAGPLGEVSSAANDQPFENEAYRSRGFYDLFTVWGREAQRSLEDEARIDVNGTGLEPQQRQQLRQQLREMLIEVFGDDRGGQLGAALPNGNVADLFDWASRMQMAWDELAQIEDLLTAGPNVANIFKINVNRAPREVLLAIPGMTEANADALLARREAEVNNDPYSIAWVMDELGQASVGLGRFVTGRGEVYSADILAVSRDGRAFRRVRIVVDTAVSTGPQIVYRRDLTDRGWPMDPAIREELRSGGSIGMFGSDGR